MPNVRIRVFQGIAFVASICLFNVPLAVGEPKGDAVGRGGAALYAGPVTSVTPPSDWKEYRIEGLFKIMHPPGWVPHAKDAMIVISSVPREKFLGRYPMPPLGEMWVAIFPGKSCKDPSGEFVKLRLRDDVLEKVICITGFPIALYLHSSDPAAGAHKKVLEAVGQSFESLFDTSDWKTYRNEKHGFEMRHPGDWFVQFEDGYATKDVVLVNAPKIPGSRNLNLPPDGGMLVQVEKVECPYFSDRFVFYGGVRPSFGKEICKDGFKIGMGYLASQVDFYHMHVVHSVGESFTRLRETEKAKIYWDDHLGIEFRYPKNYEVGPAKVHYDSLSRGLHVTIGLRPLNWLHSESYRTYSISDYPMQIAFYALELGEAAKEAGFGREEGQWVLFDRFGARAITVGRAKGLRATSDTKCYSREDMWGEGYNQGMGCENLTAVLSPGRNRSVGLYSEIFEENPEEAFDFVLSSFMFSK